MTGPKMPVPALNIKTKSRPQHLSFSCSFLSHCADSENASAKTEEKDTEPTQGRAWVAFRKRVSGSLHTFSMDGNSSPVIKTLTL